MLGDGEWLALELPIDDDCTYGRSPPPRRRRGRFLGLCTEVGAKRGKGPQTRESRRGCKDRDQSRESGCEAGIVESLAESARDWAGGRR